MDASSATALLEPPQTSAPPDWSSLQALGYSSAFSPRGRQALVLVYVDAEEEFDWSRPFSSAETRVENLEHQEPLVELLNSYGVVPTFLVDFPALQGAAAVECLGRFLEAGRITIGAQLHPWVTPPIEEEINVVNSFPGNLPPALEYRKIQRLTDTIVSRFGIHPRIYRAGRYGLGPNTADILESLGYQVDCSMYPGRSFAYEGGPEFLDCDLSPFWIGSARKVLEIPLTGGYLGQLRRYGGSVARLLEQPALAALKARSLLRCLGLLETSWLSPEGIPLEEAKQLTRALRKDGVSVFSISLHSPSMVPGNTPYVRTSNDLRALLKWLEDYLSFFEQEIGGRPAAPLNVLEIANDDT